MGIFLLKKYRLGSNGCMYFVFLWDSGGVVLAYFSFIIGLVDTGIVHIPAQLAPEYAESPTAFLTVRERR